MSIAQQLTAGDGVYAILSPVGRHLRHGIIQDIKPALVAGRLDRFVIIPKCRPPLRSGLGNLSASQPSS